MAKVNLLLLSEAQLRHLLFTTTQTLRLVVGAVRDHTKEEWKVRREVESLLERYTAEVEPHRDRTALEQIRRERANRNEQYWDGLEEDNGHAGGAG